MNKINQFFNCWEAQFGWSSLKSGGKFGVAVTVIPIISTVFAGIVLMGTIKSRGTTNKIQFALEIFAEMLK